MTDTPLYEPLIPPEPEDFCPSPHMAENTAEEPLIRVMALHALAYCERLFYLEEVEVIRVADANVYQGRRLHEKLEKEPGAATMELASETLGLRGKLDWLRETSGRAVVVEHKKGKSRGGTEPWPSDRLQVLAYALLLAEHVKTKDVEARIRYHADKKTIPVPFVPEEARAEVATAVERARTLRRSLQRPPPAVEERLCRSCSLAPVCLPEEERQAKGKEKPQRLFPADDTRGVVHIVEQGASLRRDGEQLVVHLPDGVKKALPGMTVGALVLHGYVQITAQALGFCAANDIGVHWLSYGGRYLGAFAAGAGAVQRKNRQFQALQSASFKTGLCARLVRAKVENQLRYILRATRGDETSRSQAVEEGLSGMRDALAALSRIEAEIATCVEGVDAQKESGATGGAGVDVTAAVGRIRGLEGLAGRCYFALLPQVLQLDAGHALYFQGRNRRPPRDPFNALLSFGYALLHRDCLNALLCVGLEPCFGFMHRPRSAAHPLALDLMDLFRVMLWDIPMVGSVNRKQWSEDDFERAGAQVWLNVDGRRKAIALYETRKCEKWKHPVLDYSLSYGRTIELEARLLEKEWTGQPGLFARSRLR